MAEEIWKDIENYEGKYQVSSLGRVKSLDYLRTGEERILRQYKQKGGYLFVILCKNNKVKKFLVHRLVALAFIDNPDCKEEIDHINTISDDNRACNLRWTTHKENSNNVLTIAKRYGANSCNARKVLQFTKEGVFVKEWNCMMDVQRELRFSISHISNCCLGKRKTCGGFVWKYA